MAGWSGPGRRRRGVRGWKRRGREGRRWRGSSVAVAGRKQRRGREGRGRRRRLEAAWS